MADDGELKIYKLVLVGESGVGKTCIINRFVKETFLEEGTTAFASYCEKTVNLEELGGKPIKYHIWDTAGQEKYRSIGKLFYSGSNAAVLVYDITDSKSFEEIKNYWYKQIKDHVGEDSNKFNFFNIFFIIIVIVLNANKSDLFEQEEVSEEEAKNYAKEKGMIYHVTSALNGVGVEELFKIIGKKLVGENCQNKDNEANEEEAIKNETNERIKLDIKKVNDEDQKTKYCCGYFK